VRFAFQAKSCVVRSDDLRMCLVGVVKKGWSLDGAMFQQVRRSSTAKPEAASPRRLRVRSTLEGANQIDDRDCMYFTSRFATGDHFKNRRQCVKIR
jgi:hypothetical protein